MTTTLGLPWWHPARLVATGFGLGYLPGMPGSWGSLFALIGGWGIAAAGGWPALAAAAIIAFGVGWWGAARVAQESGQEDPPFIVIDEIAAQWLALLAAPRDWRWYGAAFLLFRLFDIVKPWPIRELERGIPAGLGIMLDDVLAAIYVVALLLIAQEISHV